MIDRVHARLYALLEGGPDEPHARSVAWILVGMILLNVAAVCLETVPMLSEHFEPLFHAIERVSLVIFSGEFGRTPFVQGTNGRDHNPMGFSLWLAGGGLKRGFIYGATDEYGYRVVENAHTVRDLHATVLHQLGLDPHRLAVPGRKRLEREVGRPIREIVA